MERGVNVKKEISDVNIQEEGLISQRLVYDHLL